MKKILFLAGILSFTLVGCQSTTVEPETNDPKREEAIQAIETLSEEEGLDSSLITDEMIDSIISTQETANEAIKLNAYMSLKNIVSVYIMSNQTVPVEGEPTIDEFMASYDDSATYKIDLGLLPQDVISEDTRNFTFTIDKELNVHVI